jgi:hypothetical protein
VTDIAEHDGKQEGESDDGEQSRVDLLVRTDTVSVDNVLETFGELVRAVESRRSSRSAKLVQDGRN